MRSLIWAGVLFWLVMLFTFLLYCGFYILENHRPHFAWWILTTVVMIVTGVRAFVLFVQTLRFDSRPMLATGIFMAVLAPLVLVAAFLAELNQMAHARGDIKITAPAKCIALWGSGYLEIEARCRYRRITEGKFVELFDDGKLKDPESLVEQMDEHIKSMSESIGRPTPQQKTAWIRGSLFGHSGRAICMLAICDTQGPLESLEYIDRHEAAHTTLFGVASLKQEPPMLLAEGWAQVNSIDLDEMVVSLSNSRKYDEAPISVQQMVQAPRYGQSTGPAYSIGGPFVNYLIEEFGGEVVAQLYEEAKRSSFEEDFESIVGLPLKDSETKFWNWLQTKYDAIDQTELEDEPIDTAPRLVFEIEEDKDAWQEIAESAKNLKAENSRPENLAVQITLEYEQQSAVLSSIFQADSFWGSCSYSDEQIASEFAVINGELYGHVYQIDHDGTVEINDIDRNSMVEMTTNWLNWTKSDHLYRHLPLLDEFGSDTQFTISEIVKDAQWEGRNCWIVSVIRSGKSIEGQSQSDYYLDPNNRFKILRIADPEQDETSDTQYSTEAIDGQEFATMRTTIPGRNLRRISVRKLETPEIEKIKLECNRVVKDGKANVITNQRTIKIPNTPWLWGIMWLVLAVVFIGVDLFCESDAVRRNFSATT